MQENELKKIGSYLLSAIDMEESFAKGVYVDYTNKSNWPDDIDQDTYEKIQTLLKVLINDTKRHSRIFSEIKKKLANS